MNNPPLTSRRNFMKDVAQLGGMSILLSACPWLASLAIADETQNQQLSLGVIGTGSRGQFHLDYLQNFKNVKVVALCDIREEQRKVAGEKFPQAEQLSDYKALLDRQDIDAVIITTPLHLHAQMTIDALDAGKHVFCEKSLARSAQDCLRVYQAYQNSKQVLYVGQQRLFDPKYIKAMSMVHAGTFGDIASIRCYWYRNNDWRRPVPRPELERAINWRLYKEYSAGLLTELATHQLQVGNWAMKMIPESIVGFGDLNYWKDGREVYDNISLLYRYPNGTKMSYESVISNKHLGLEEMILGSKGTIEPEKGNYYFEEATPAPGIMQLINQIEHSLFDEVAFANPSWVPETAGIYKAHKLVDGLGGHSGASSVGALHDGTLELLTAFCAAAISGEKAKVLVEEAYYSSVLALLGEQSMEEGKVITFPQELKIPYLNHA